MRYQEKTPSDGRYVKADISKNEPWFVYGYYLDSAVFEKGYYDN